MFIPKLITCLREGYSLKTFGADFFAGVTVGVVAIPLAMAFAIASGVSPDRGLFTAVVAGFLISALGGSRVQIGGPTGAFVVIIYSIVQRHGYEGLAIATLMAGALVFAMGLFRFGSAIKFIPYPVITGFTSGIALIIFSSQMKDFFGLRMGAVPADFIAKWHAYLQHGDAWNPYALLIAVSGLLLLILMRRFVPRVPAAIIVVVLAGSFVHFLGLPVETIGSRFGELPHMLPMPHFPHGISTERIRELAPDAITIALLCAIESLLSAVVADGMTGYSHKSNMELVGQGIANIGSVLFGGIPATGAIARTATNIKSGAKTPVAGMIHAATILLTLWLLGPLASMVPLASLAAILVLIAWNMSEASHFIRLFRAPKEDVAVLLITFFLTVLVDLTLAVGVGMVLAMLLFLQRMRKLTALEKAGLSEDDERDDSIDAIADRQVPEGVEVYEMNGPFFFGAADRLKSALKRIEKPPKVFILRMRRVPVIDASGLRALEVFIDDCRRGGTTVIVAELTPKVRHTVVHIKLHEKIGRGNICSSIDDALKRAREFL